MIEANVKIIKELKEHLTIICEDVSIRQFFVHAIGDFSRKRSLPMDRVIGLILNLPKRSLAIELTDYFEQLDLGTIPSKAAFSLQRTKLKSVFFYVWNTLIVHLHSKHYGEKVKRWKGFKLYAVDGSRAYLCNTPKVIQHFGTQDNQYVEIPMAQIVQIHDVLNDLIVWGTIAPVKCSEQSIIAQALERLPADSLSLFDRGFPSYRLMYLLSNQEQPRHFLMRCKIGFNTVVKAFMQSKQTSRVIDLTPDKNAIEQLRAHGYIITSQTRLKVRMLKVELSSGETEVLLTNLFDENAYPLSAMKALYFMRWGIEVAYGTSKNQLQLEQFSGHTVHAIEQDYWAGLFVYNLQSIISNQCEEDLKKVNATRKYRYKVNKNVSWGSLKHQVIKLLLTDEPEQALRCLQQKFSRFTEPVRPNRNNPRTMKKNRVGGKYQTLTNYKRAI